jgi:hypothetical protein
MNQLEEMDVEELLRVNIRLTKENNRLLKKMRRDALISFWGRILFLLVVSGALYYVYQFYLQETFLQLFDMYNSLQDGVENFKNMSNVMSF